MRPTHLNVLAAVFLVQLSIQLMVKLDGVTRDQILFTRARLQSKGQVVDAYSALTIWSGTSFQSTVTGRLTWHGSSRFGGTSMAG